MERRKLVGRRAWRAIAGVGALALGVSQSVAGCGDDADTTTSTASSSSGAGGSGGAPITVPAGFERFCEGKDIASTLEPASVGKLGGDYVGYYAMGQTAAGMTVPTQVGTLEMMKVVPAQPFFVDKIRVAFGAGTGKARIHLETTFGRSYPASFPAADPDYKKVQNFQDYDPNAVDVIPPVDVDVTDAMPEHWIELDVSAAHAALLPTQHYMIVFEHLEAEPHLAIETVPAGEYSRALLLFPDQSGAFGVADQDDNGANYRLELVGRNFCSWSEPERWFRDEVPPLFQQGTWGAGEIADVDGDGNDDLVASVPRAGDGPLPKAFFGDGNGNFTEAPFDSLALAANASMLAFADLDGDGDEDVFATPYVYPDQDGDAHTVQAGDCDDLDPAVHPGATEAVDGKDDDCNGVADDGTSGATDMSDADGDGVTVADGDCDDTNPDVHPAFGGVLAAAERLNAVDDDCNGLADDGIGNVVLLNTTAACADPSGNCAGGDGHFVRKPSPAVEFSEPASAIGVGDANGDGKIDIYWGDWLVHYPDAPAVPSHFVEGNGDGTFTDAMASAGMNIPVAKPVYGVTFNDYDGDGLQDVYVGDYQLNDNLMWRNLGNGQFMNVAHALGVDHDGIASPYSQYPGGHSYGSDFGDVDNDGKMDFFQANLSHPRTQPWADPSQLYFNQGGPDFAFVDQRHARGIVYDEGDINGQFGDFDDDGDLDLAIGSLYTGHYDKLYRNDGDHFTDVTFEAGVAVHQAQNVGFADFDEDGWLDLFAKGSDVPQIHLFMNRGGSNHWVEMRLQGTASNRDAIGARVTLTAGGVTQIRDVRGTCGGGISVDLCSRVVHFGLGANTSIDSVKVRWVKGTTPNGSPEETIGGVQPDGIYRIVEGTGAATKLQ
jgi:hypothetical protein